MDTVRMQAPAGATQCSHNAVVYKVVSGFVNVLQMAVADLQAHGFAVAPEQTVGTDAEAEAKADVVAKSDAEAKAKSDADAAIWKKK